MGSLLPDLCVCSRRVFLCKLKMWVFFPPPLDRINAAMCKICMLSASARKRVLVRARMCVCVPLMTAGLIKLLHSNELWLSVWQLL